jgi:vacuolar protein sorting-associated protein VTA1
MAAAELCPPSLKPIEMFIERGVDFDPVNPIIGYYCRVYALQQGIDVCDKSDPNAQEYIKNLLQQCEARRAVLSPNVEQHRDELVAFTTGMFERCVSAYRAGNVDRGLAVDFVKTSQLIEVTSYFDQLSEVLQLMKKRCVELAAEIDMQLSGSGTSSSHAESGRT